MMSLAKVMSFQTSGFLYSVSQACRDTGLEMNVRYRELERIHGVPISLVQGPGNILVQVLYWCLCLLRHMSHYRVDHLALVVPFFTLHNILR